MKLNDFSNARRFHGPVFCGPAWMRAAALFSLAAGSLSAANGYVVHNLVSDLPGLADHVDKNLVNPWGNGFSGSSPFWIGNNGTGTSTLYDGTGAPVALVVKVPAAAGATTPGPVTGVIANTFSPSFNAATGKPASFLFCTLDGTISGWNSSVNATNAQIMADNSKSGAVYPGCVLGGTSATPFLYAANFNSGKIDVWDGTMQPVTTAAFTDLLIPAGYAPYNIANLGGKLYVAYAKQDATKRVDVAGAGNGYIAVFDYSGNLVANLVSQGSLNAPWGMAIAPSTFGDFAGALLVGNFGDGRINAFNVSTGASLGALNDALGSPIELPGLWSLEFGNGGRGGDPGTLYFTAGIAGPSGEPIQSHGLLGSIQAAPSFQVSGVVNAASFSSTIAPNSWVTILGSGLSATTRSWDLDDVSGGNLPTTLDHVTVTVNGTPAYVSYVSPMQINFLVPANITPGPAQIQTTSDGLTSASISATLAQAAPAFFVIGTNSTTKNQYIAATHANNSLIGPPSLITGVTTTPATVGETIVLYANGLGATNPAVTGGQLITAPVPLATQPTVTIGGLSAKVTFSGLVAPGLYQLNVVVPSGLTPGTTANIDVPVVVQVGSAQSQSNAIISVVNPSGT